MCLCHSPSPSNFKSLYILKLFFVLCITRRNCQYFSSVQIVISIFYKLLNVCNSTRRVISGDWQRQHGNSIGKLQRREKARDTGFETAGRAYARRQRPSDSFVVRRDRQHEPSTKTTKNSPRVVVTLDVCCQTPVLTSRRF